METAAGFLETGLSSAWSWMTSRKGRVARSRLRWGIGKFTIFVEYTAPTRQAGNQIFDTYTPNTYTFVLQACFAQRRKTIGGIGGKDNERQSQPNRSRTNVLLGWRDGNKNRRAQTRRAPQRRPRINTGDRTTSKSGGNCGRFWD